MEFETIELLKQIKGSFGPLLCILGMIFIWICGIAYRVKLLLENNKERLEESKKQTALLKKLIPAPEPRKLGKEKPHRPNVGKFLDSM